MKAFDQERYNEFLISKGVVGFKEEPITLKSGKLSRWYANCRILSQSTENLENIADMVTDFFYDLVEDQNLNLGEGIIGVPEGATLLGNRVQEMLIEHDLVKDRLFQIRSKPKDHGDVANRYWTNGNVPDKVVVFEDVTTTGGSTIDFIEKLGESEVEVTGVVGLLNRLQLDKNGQSVKEKLNDLGLDYFSLADASNILLHAYNLLEDKSNYKAWINEEYKSEYSKFGLEVPFKL